MAPAKNNAMQRAGDHQFIISDINGRFNSILRKPDYRMLAGCRSFEDFIIKLNQRFPFINEDMEFTIPELRARLYHNILDELREFRGEGLALLDYFVEYNKILTFFVTLETHSDLPRAGAMDEFRGLSACRTFGEAVKLYIRNTALEKYFGGVGDGDMQEMMATVLKRYFDFYYRNRAAGYFREIMEAEGDRQIYEICLNGGSLKNRRAYFPDATTLSERAMAQLGDAERPEDVREILCPGAEDPLSSVVERKAHVYAESFRQHDDLSCVYAYFRLKEQEMHNILWIAECIMQGGYDVIDEIITFE